MMNYYCGLMGRAYIITYYGGRNSFGEHHYQARIQDLWKAGGGGARLIRGEKGGAPRAPQARSLARGVR